MHNAKFYIEFFIQSWAYFIVHYCAFFSACFLLLFHSFAASLLSGSSGLGYESKL